MVILQKKAIFLLVALTLDLMVGGLIVAFLPTGSSRNVVFLGQGINQIVGYGLWQASFLVIIVLGDFLFQKRGDDVLDERDQEICRKSSEYAMTAFWLVFGAACAGLVLTIAPLKLAIPAVWVIGPLIVGGLVVYSSAYSLAILIQYGHEHRDE